MLELIEQEYKIDVKKSMVRNPPVVLAIPGKTSGDIHKVVIRKDIPRTMGREKFYEFCAQKALIKYQKRNRRKTTQSDGVKRFDNKIKGMELKGVNQVWDSDITYYEMNDKFY